MARMLDRKTLESMRRADLQRLCKDHGIKANLKSEALVDLLLDAQQPRIPPPPSGAAAGRRSSSMRIVSRSSANSRQRGMSGSSMIIHDTDDEKEPLEADSKEPSAASEPAPLPAAPAYAPSPSPASAFNSGSAPPSALPRPKKAKQTQYRLGVGRPTLAGGNGPRAITKSLSLSKKRGKVSTSVKPTEVAIQEEDEEHEESAPIAGPSGTSHDADPFSTVPSSSPPAQVDQQADRLIQPLKQQLQALQAEVQQLTAKATDIDSLRSQVSALTLEVQSLRTTVSQMSVLEDEIKRLRSDVNTTISKPLSSKSVGKARATEIPTTLEPAALAAPSPAQPLLGKRQRSEDSDIMGVVEAAQSGLNEKDLARQVLRPTRKRAKLSPKEVEYGSSSQRNSPAHGGDLDVAEDDDDLTVPAVPPPAAFTVFSGPEEPLDTYIDPPPPTEHLSDFLGLPPAGSNGTGPNTLTANANENARPNSAFNFSFTSGLLTSTPAGTFMPDVPSLPAFTYPEPPTSPTPGGNADPSGGYVERAGGRRERNDLFHPYGAPRRAQSSASGSSRPPSRASHTPTRPAAGPGSDGTVNPALLRTPPLAAVIEQPEPAGDASMTSNAVGQGLGMSTMPLPPETPAPPAKRTMYGTELEGDRRFGDFGVEGVATGFWTGVPIQPRF